MAFSDLPSYPINECEPEKRVAIIDLGSNSWRVVIYAYVPRKWWKRVDELYDPVRIARGLAESGRLSEVSITRGKATLAVFTGFCETAGIAPADIEAVATSAVRDAENSSDLLRGVSSQYGFNITVLSAEEEALYGFIAAVASTGLQHGAVLDIGGGSMQLVEAKDGRVGRWGSWPLGAVRVTEQLMAGGKPLSLAEVKAVRKRLRKELAGAEWLSSSGPRLVGIGGAVRNLANAAQRRYGWSGVGIQGFRLTRPQLSGLVETLAALPANERSTVPGIKAGRGDIILASALLLETVLQLGEFDAVEVTRAGLREGVFFGRRFNGTGDQVTELLTPPKTETATGDDRQRTTSTPPKLALRPLSIKGATEYLLPPGIKASSLEALLGPHLDLMSEQGAPADRTYFDTFDKRLSEAGLSLVVEGGTQLILNGKDCRTETLALRRTPKKLFAADLPESSLRAVLDSVVEMRALLPTARITSWIQQLRVIDKSEKTVVRLATEEPWLVAADSDETSPLAARIYVFPVRGYDKAATQTKRTLKRELGFVKAPRTLRQEAAGASESVEAPGKLSISLAATQRVSEAAQLVLDQLADVIELNIPGTLADIDTEFLHDLRVAVRRTRSVQRQLREIFPAELERFRTEFRWLQQVTGPTRDLDVYLLDFAYFRSLLPVDVHQDLEPIHALLERRRKAAFRRMVKDLRTDRTGMALTQWKEFVGSLDRSKLTVAEVVGKRIHAVHRQMVRMGSGIDDSSEPESLHDLRKKGKELRYLLELFGSAYPKDVIKPMVRSLKSLQDTLGRFQDREVQAMMLRAERDVVAGLRNGASALMAMGLLVDRLETESADARAEFAARFGAFATKEQRKLVRETF